MISLFGWIMMVRGIQMIPFYGCGFGLASAMMSRVYAVTTPVHPRLKMRILRVIWRGDTEGIEQLRASAAGACRGGPPHGGEPAWKPGGLGYNPQLNPLEGIQRICSWKRTGRELRFARKK